MTGQKVGGEVRWRWAHLEPYLRRTYKGTTAEMAQAIRDGLSGKKKPPPPDAREKPGLGPEPKKTSRLLEEPDYRADLAVIPTVVIGGPLAQLTCRTPDGVPFLAPEVQLLYKATDAPRPKDEADLAAVLPRLGAERREWLAAALRQYRPRHPWLARLNEA